MLIFLGIVFLVYGSLHLYALGKLWQLLPHSPGMAALVITAGILLTLTPFIVWYLERQHWHRATTLAAWASYLWMGYVFLFFWVGLLFDAGQLLATFFRHAWPLTVSANVSGIALLAFVALLYGLFEAGSIRIERITLHSPKLAGRSITIAQLSDMHLGAMSGTAFLDKVMDRLIELKPDIVVATGDIVDGQGDNLNAMSSHFHRYAAPMGNYAVTGNHEHFMGLARSLGFLRSAGFTVLRGETIHAGNIVIAGVDDHTARVADAPAESEIAAQLDSQHEKNFVLLLKHQPIVNDAEKFDLQLSGHIHGGQIFPFGYLTRLSYRFGTGLTQLPDGRTLYVSRGTGTWGPPIRLLAPPEITLITLMPETGG